MIPSDAPDPSEITPVVKLVLFAPLIVKVADVALVGPAIFPVNVK